MRSLRPNNRPGVLIRYMGRRRGCADKFSESMAGRQFLCGSQQRATKCRGSWASLEELGCGRSKSNRAPLPLLVTSTGYGAAPSRIPIAHAFCLHLHLHLHLRLLCLTPDHLTFFLVLPKLHQPSLPFPYPAACNTLREVMPSAPLPSSSAAILSHPPSTSQPYHEASLRPPQTRLRSAQLYCLLCSPRIAQRR